MSTVTYIITPSFLASTPGVAEPTAGGFPAISAAPGQFLLKDLVLLAASRFAWRHRSDTFLANRGNVLHPAQARTVHEPFPEFTRPAAQPRLGLFLVVLGFASTIGRPGRQHTKGDPSWRCASWPKRPTAIVAVGEA